MIAGSGLAESDSPSRAAITATKKAIKWVPHAQRRLLIVFACGECATQPEVIVAAAEEVSGISNIIGCSGAGVLTNEGEIEGSGVAVLVIGATPVHTRCTDRFGSDPHHSTRTVFRDLDIEDHGSIISFFDAMSVHPDSMLDGLQRLIPANTPIIGGGAINDLNAPWVIDHSNPTTKTSNNTLSATWLPDAQMQTALSVGGRALGSPLPVTKAQGGVIVEIAGKRALDILSQTVKQPMMSDLTRLSEGVFAGLPGPTGHLMLRPLIAIDPQMGAIAIGGSTIKSGDEIAFVLKDRDYIRHGLQSSLRELQAHQLASPKFGLFIRGAGRGANLYGPTAGIETALVSSAFPMMPFAGFLSGCELAPAGRGGVIHLFSSILGIFTDRL